MTNAPPIAALLACPTCRAGLARVGDKGWNCTSCSAVYPDVNGIPWLLPEPQATFWEWKGRLKILLQRLEMDAETLKQEVKIPGLGELTLKRLRKLLQAKVEHRKALATLLEPLELGDAGSFDMSKALHAKVPARQTLTSYYSNLHRDWAWETTENAESLAATLAVIEPPMLGTTLVLGAGGGRLAFDLQRKFKPSLMVLTDINPLIFFAVKRILDGKSIKLYEFPIAPKDLDSHAVLRKLAAPEAIGDGVELLFADALRPPFAHQSFDVVVTPWLVDIIPAEFGVLARQVNRLLKTGGRWINFGSLTFNQVQQSQNYSTEEALQLVEDSGFAAPNVRHATIPYMRSPASFHGRVETTTAFQAVKARDVAADPPYQYLPEWLTRSDVAIPRSRALDGFTAMHAILLEVAALVDGQRTMTDVSQIFAGRHKIRVEEAEASIRRFLTRHFEENQVGAQY